MRRIGRLSLLALLMFAASSVVGTRSTREAGTVGTFRYLNTCSANKGCWDCYNQMCNDGGGHSSCYQNGYGCGAWGTC